MFIEQIVNSTYSFKDFRTINIFGRNIYNGKITLKEANEDQSNLLVEILNLTSKTEKSREKNNRKKMFLKTYIIFFDAFESKIFPIKTKRAGFSDKVSDHSNLKILTPKQKIANSSCTSKNR